MNRVLKEHSQKADQRRFFMKVEMAQGITHCPMNKSSQWPVLDADCPCDSNEITSGLNGKFNPRSARVPKNAGKAIQETPELAMAGRITQRPKAFSSPK